MIAAKIIDIAVDKFQMVNNEQLIAPVIRLFNLITFTPQHTQPPKIYQFLKLFNLNVEKVYYMGTDAIIRISGAFNLSYAELRGFIQSQQLNVYCDHRPYAEICESMTAHPSLDSHIKQNMDSFQVRTQPMQIIPSENLVRYSDQSQYQPYGPFNGERVLSEGPINCIIYHFKYPHIFMMGEGMAFIARSDVSMSGSAKRALSDSILIKSGGEITISHTTLDTEGQYAVPCELLANRYIISQGNASIDRGTILEAREGIVFESNPDNSYPETLAINNIDQRVVLSRLI